MAVRPSLEDILKDIPHEKLNQPCRDDHLSEIALSITDWQSIAPFLGLTEAEIEEIEGDRAKTRPQKIAMLWKWRKRFGRKATYRKLVKVFWKLKRADLVEEVRELLLTESSSSSSEEEDGPTDDLSAAKRSQRRSPGSYAKNFGRGHVTAQSEVVEIFEPTIAMDSTSSHAKKNVEKNCGESETRKTGTFRKVWKKLFGKKKRGKTEKRISLDSDVDCLPAAKRTQKGALDSDADCPPTAMRTQKGALDSDADCPPTAKRTQKGALDSDADCPPIAKRTQKGALDSDADCPPTAMRTQKGALDSDADCPPAAKRTQKGALDSDADCLPAAKRTQKGTLDSDADCPPTAMRTQKGALDSDADCPPTAMRTQKGALDSDADCPPTAKRTQKGALDSDADCLPTAMRTQKGALDSDADCPPTAMRTQKGALDSDADCPPTAMRTQKGALDSDADCPPTAMRTQKGALDSDADCPPAAMRTQKGALDSDVDCLPTAMRTQKGALDSYADYLRGRYSTELPAFFTLQWPPPPTHKVFNLAMIGHQTIQRGLIDEELVRLTLRGGVDDIIRRKSSIELKNLFKLDNRRRKIILIEGAPGAGKSTLAWHIVQKWEAGELFQEFRVVVFVQLRDPAIQSAKSLADLLPARSSNMRVELQSNMEACDGRGVLFVLDGWDEYSPGLQHGLLFQQLICRPGEVNMHFSSLVITSRPIASGELQRYVSSRVEIVGFTSAEVKKYFVECIQDSEHEQKLKGGESETVQKFRDHLRERPVIEASCYLPLNAAIIVHLFLSLSHTLPHTLHEVFLSLVCCCITRHLTKEAEEGENSPDILSLDDLPPDVLKPFNNICTLAYHGVMENKATFSVRDLRSFNLPTEFSTLSLIQGVQNLAAKQFNVSFNFLHLSVQELLAAFHISKLPEAKQIQIFNDLFDQPRLAAVFRFYAAFTKLHTEGVRDIVARIVQKKEKPLLVNLLHGLYEAQDPSLCQFVASHLKGGLDLSENTLSPMDCLVVGYFLSCVCLTTSGEFKVDLSGCSLDDYRASFLIREMVKQLSKCSNLTDADGAPGCLALDLQKNQLSGRCIDSLLHILNVISSMYITDPTQNDSLEANMPLNRLSAGKCGISEKGGKAIGDALMVNRYLQVLDLHGNPISAGVVHIAESLKHNHSLLEINLGRCGISEKGGKAIGDALMVNRSLQVLELYSNPISAGVVHIAESLKHNHSLQEINLGDCGISEKEGKAIGDALTVNRSLQVLDLRDNPISGVVHIAESFKRNHSLLKVRFGGHGLSVDNVKTLCDALMVDCRSLRVHCLLGNSMTVERGKAIGGPRMANVLSVQMLDLEYSPISTAVVHIAESLKHNHSLLEINLSNCDISEKECEAIGEALMVNRSLQVLDLYDNPISAGVEHIAESLKHNHSLLKVNLSRCDISEKGAKSLAISLKENNSLLTLILSRNYLSDGAAAHIADGLRHNDHLKKLDILGCSIGDQGMKSLGCALKMNSSLEDLNVTWNHSVTGVGLLALGESLKKNRGLKRLKLWRLPNISDNDWKQFIVCLQENNHLTKLHLLSSTQEVVRQETTTLNDIRIEHNLPPLSVIW